MAEFKEAVRKSAVALWRSLPILLGVILLIGLVSTLVPKNIYISLFRGNLFADSFIGGVLGSIMAGNPITSYLLGGEFLKEGVSLVAVTAFLVAWVTVGLVQLPAESIMLGKRFAIFRNVLSFIFAVIVAILTVIIMGAI